MQLFFTLINWPSQECEAGYIFTYPFSHPQKKKKEGREQEKKAEKLKNWTKVMAASPTSLRNS